jgi:hypothetical protein
MVNYCFYCGGLGSLLQRTLNLFFFVFVVVELLKNIMELAYWWSRKKSIPNFRVICPSETTDFHRDNSLFWRNYIWEVVDPSKPIMQTMIWCPQTIWGHPFDPSWQSRLTSARKGNKKEQKDKRKRNPEKKERAELQTGVSGVSGWERESMSQSWTVPSLSPQLIVNLLLINTYTDIIDKPVCTS